MASPSDKKATAIEKNSHYIHRSQEKGAHNAMGSARVSQEAE